MKKVLSVRVENKLYTKVCNYGLPNSKLVTRALVQYFRNKEPNKTLFSENNPYNIEYVDMLKQSLSEKENYINFLQKEVENLTVMNMAKVPLLARVKMRFLKEKSE